MENMAISKIKGMIAKEKLNLADKKKEEMELLDAKIKIYDELIETETNIQYNEEIVTSFEVHDRLNRLAIIFGILIFVLEGLMFNIGVFPLFNSLGISIAGNIGLALISFICYRTVIAENLKKIKMHNLDEVKERLALLEEMHEEIEMRLSKNEVKMHKVIESEARINTSIIKYEDALYNVATYLVGPNDTLDAKPVAKENQVHSRKRK